MKRPTFLATAGIVLALVGVATWGWAFDFSTGAGDNGPTYPVVVHRPDVKSAIERKSHLYDSARLVSSTRLAIYPYYAGSCPFVPDEIVALSPNVIRIHLTAGGWTPARFVANLPSSGVCHSPAYGLTTERVAIDPTIIDVHHPLTVRFIYGHSKKSVVWTAAPLKG